jgi:hypothetical protein
MYGVYKSDDGSEPEYVYSPQDNYTHIAQSQLWWVDETTIKELVSVVKDWEDNGFKFWVGNGVGTRDIPEKIEYEWQERRQGNRWTTSTRGDEALIGYRLVWFEIVDAEKAFTYMQSHTDIPVAVKCDIYDYSSNDRYRQVFDYANDLFIYYLHYGRPKDAGGIVDEKTLLENLYDL